MTASVTIARNTRSVRVSVVISKKTHFAETNNDETAAGAALRRSDD